MRTNAYVTVSVEVVLIASVIPIDLLAYDITGIH